ncbi:GNAT family N-acetyltransferase [Micromonospora sp. HNM0581]|uniref:GNAT family N-acetyltransferase n=1 Tax=Micromonospora sp. HNM0581 TaxID=2716341 RepID=UPI001F0FC0CE|nr:GNAT family N-acetyltransferase [Micromonospora sp. HNM0581]
MTAHRRSSPPGSNPALSGKFEFGWPDFHEESLRAMHTEPRWLSDCLEEADGGMLLGALQVSWPRRAGIPRGLLGDRVRAAVPGPSERVLVVGSTTRYVGGALVRERTDPWASSAVLRTLARRAGDLAAEQKATLVALAVPHGQVPILQQAWPTARCAPCDLWATIDLAGATTPAAFVATLPREVRYNWRRDRARFDASGLTLDREACSDELLDEAAGLVADVARRNGVDDDPMLVRWRLDQWCRHSAGRVLCLTVRDGKELIGVCFVRVTGDLVDAFEVGLHAEHPARHTVYATIVFRATVELATECGVDRVELGIGHPETKAHRGASLTRLWNVVTGYPR